MLEAVVSDQAAFEQAVRAESRALYGLALSILTDAKNGWAFAIAGPSDTTNELLRTTDGGATWRQVQAP